MYPHALELEVDDTLGSVVWGVSVEIVNFFHKECRFGTFLEEMYLYPVVCLAWSITRSLNVPIVIRVLTTLPCTHGSYTKKFFLVLLLSRPPTRSIMATRLMWPMSDSHLTTNTCYLPEATILGENFNIILLIQGYSASFPGLPHFQYCWLCGWRRVIGLWLCRYLLLLFFILFSLAFSFGSVSDYRNRPYNDVILMWYPEIPIVEVSNFWF